MSKTVFFLILVVLSSGFSQLQTDVGISEAKDKKNLVVDFTDKMTNSKIFKSAALWYNNARLMVKAVNREYDLFMRSLRIVQQELAFVEYMARKIEKISSTEFNPNDFWGSMAELEECFNSIDEIYTTDLQYFDYLVGYQKETFINFMNFKLPDFGKSVKDTRKIWGGVPDFYRKDAKLSKLPEVKMMMANQFVSSQAYRNSGLTLNTINQNAKSHDRNKIEMDKIGNSPVKYLQYENAYTIDYLYEKIMEINGYKQKITADAQILLTRASLKDMRDANAQNVPSYITSHY